MLNSLKYPFYTFPTIAIFSLNSRMRQHHKCEKVYHYFKHLSMVYSVQWEPTEDKGAQFGSQEVGVPRPWLPAGGARHHALQLLQHHTRSLATRHNKRALINTVKSAY